MDKQKIFQLAGFCIGVAALVFACWFSWRLVSIFLSSLSEAKPQTTAVVLGAAITALIGLVATLYTQRQIKSRDIDEAHREKKIELYSGFLHIVRRLLSGENPNVPVAPLEPNELLEFMLNFKTEIMLWSSPAVLKCFQAFERESTSGAGFEVISRRIDDLYRAMRSDIGLSNRSLPRNALVKMYLKDPSELDNAIANGSL